MSDLTERLVAKLVNETNYVGIPGLILVNRVREWLPLLLSEPELVAALMAGGGK